jgi:hypothetical protein
MSDHQVKYEMSLNDLMTSKIKAADGAVNHLEGSLHHASSEAMSFGKEMIGALGVGFALFKGIAFVEQGVEAMHVLHQSIAQVEAGLKSTGEAAGLTFDEIEKQAKEFSKELPYSRAMIMDMQAQLLTFPKVAGETFHTASEAILDMATRTHRGLNEVAIMVGKALQDPERGITAMRRVGVNFDEAQTDIIKKLVETGHAAEAQTMILKELSSEFGGSAKAAAEADPLFRYNKIMGSIKLAVGEAALELLHRLTPALESIANTFKAGIEWARQHADGLKYIALAVGIAGAGFIIYEAIINGVSLATKIWTGVQWLLNAAINANPIALLIVTIATVVTSIIYAYNHFAKFRAILWGVWETIKEFGRLAMDAFMGLSMMMHGVFTFNSDEIKAGFNRQLSVITESGQRLGAAFKKGYDGGMADFAKDQSKDNAPKTIAKVGKTGKVGDTGKAETAKATGNKSVTINIKIDNLVKEFQVKTTTIAEGANKAKELITQALLSAVNDSQIIAGS